MPKKVKINLKWTILVNHKSIEIWLPIPIEDFNQKILSLHFSTTPQKEIKKELFHYIYLTTSKNKNVNAEVEVLLKKIGKYRAVLLNNSQFLQNNKFLKIEKTKNMALRLKTPKKIYEWIVANIKFPKNLSKYLKDLNWTANAFSVLRNKEGECGSKSLLFVSLCRALGIPARIVSGYFLKEGFIQLRNAKFNKEGLELHQWAEFFDKNYWVPVDCSLAQEENKDYFGKFDDYRIIISKDMNIKLIHTGKIPFLHIGEIKPKSLTESTPNMKLNLKLNKL